MDASVARSAGEGTAPALERHSGRCRAALLAISETEHRVVFTPEISAEWTEHARSFARGWRRQMVARKRAVFLSNLEDASFREGLVEAASSRAAGRALLKDAHLIEAAQATDRIVVSCDEKARSLFRQVCPQIAGVRRISWANPGIEEEEVVPWLQRGAPREAGRELGSR